MSFVCEKRELAMADLECSGLVYVESHGCSENYADGQMMENALRNEGYRVVSRPEDATFLVYNTCAVKGPTENRMIHILKNSYPSKKLIVTGCLPNINFKRLNQEVRFDAAIGPSPGSQIVEVIRRIEHGEKPISLRRDSKPNLSLLSLTPAETIRIVPISYGCTSSCTFCSVPLARGRLRSYEPTEILRQVEIGVRSGIKEIWLTATDLVCYGWDLKTTLPDLLKRICHLTQKFHVRLGMMNPSYLPRILDDLTSAIASEKFFKFLHLPLQSGDEDVLKFMRRHYSPSEFAAITNELRAKIGFLTLATDVICGFPGETEEAFERTLETLSTIKPDIVNVSQFHPRPGTRAAKMHQVPNGITKQRSKRASDLAQEISLERNSNWVGWQGEVLIDEKGKNGTWKGRNFAYKPVVIAGEGDLGGKFIVAKVLKAHHNFLEAEIN
ncbi:MAG: tRNA (N(6)-L-threonylcarbamoyladenosine(37)-C(2))-methylthiotransferase [Candidatus Bathyarchaeia archaeon]